MVNPAARGHISAADDSRKDTHMKNLYAQILEDMKQGEEAVMVTTCSGSEAAHTIYRGEAASNWKNRQGSDKSLYIERTGSQTIIVEHFKPRSRMFVFGGGHIALPFAHIASMLNFDVTVYDDRPSFANAARFPDASEIICDSFDNISKLVEIRQSDYVVIITRGHRHDEDCLRVILSGRLPCYMGMIGSKRRVAIVKNRMKDEGFDPEKIDALRAPIGLAIGAVTPEEIAVSIAAEVVRKRRAEFSPTAGECAASGPAESDPEMKLIEWLADGHSEDGALVTVISADGSTPRGAGAKMIIKHDGGIIGSIGGGCAEADVCRAAADIIRSGGYAIKTVDLTGSAAENDMICGGSMVVLIERID